MSAIEYILLGVEQYLRELPDDEFDALVRSCRPPKSVRYPARKAKRGKAEREVSV